MDHDQQRDASEEAYNRQLLENPDPEETRTVFSNYTDEAREVRMHKIAKAMRQIEAGIGAEMEAYRRDMTKAISTYCVDDDFDSTVRNMLISFENDGFDLQTFLADESESSRYHDLVRVWRMLERLSQPENYSRDELSHLYMQYSLCPLHHWDWAICFDDEDPECSQIRAIFPHGHDT